MGQSETVAENISEAISTTFQSFIAVLPEIIGALVILLLGWILGVALGRIVRRLVDEVELDRHVMKTPLGGAMGGTEKSVSKFFAAITRWFIYALAILTAASFLDIAILSEWISQAVTYLPSLVAGLLTIILGFILADFIGDMISKTEMATRSSYTSWFADGVRVFMYFLFITIGLDTMGLDVTLLYILARALAWGAAIGLALAVGIGFGWGMKDYISENIDKWASSAKEEASQN